MRMVSAVVGSAAVVGMGTLDVVVGADAVESAPVTLVAPPTVETGGGAGWVTTTSSNSSFRPVVTASIPPPPED